MALTPEQMVAMAIEADCMRVNMYGDVAMAVERLSRFAALVTAKEREACALVCDAKAKDGTLSNRRRCDADSMAMAIRARGKP